MKKEEPKPFKDMVPLTKVDWEKFKKNPIPRKKQETLEEAAEKWLNKDGNPDFNAGVVYGFIEGAKWQQEIMYSEEEVKTILFHRETHYIKTNHHLHIDNWFKQFKKK